MIRMRNAHRHRDGWCPWHSLPRIIYDRASGAVREKWDVVRYQGRGTMCARGGVRRFGPRTDPFAARPLESAAEPPRFERFAVGRGGIFSPYHSATLSTSKCANRTVRRASCNYFLCVRDICYHYRSCPMSSHLNAPSYAGYCHPITSCSGHLRRHHVGETEAEWWLRETRIRREKEDGGEG